MTDVTERTDVSTLSEFLLARLAEDEAVAVSVAADNADMSDSYVANDDRLFAADHPYFNSIVATSAARVLADVATKRAIIAKRGELIEHMNRVDPLGLHSNGAEGQVHTLDWVMRQMADVYSAHPDYAAGVSWYEREWPQ